MQLNIFEDLTKDTMVNPNAKSYREKWGLQLPGPGARVQLEWMGGVNHYILWLDCPDDENILYGWKKSKKILREIVENHNWKIVS